MKSKILVLSLLAAVTSTARASVIMRCFAASPNKRDRVFVKQAYVIDGSAYVPLGKLTVQLSSNDVEVMGARSTDGWTVALRSEDDRFDLYAHDGSESSVRISHVEGTDGSDVVVIKLSAEGDREAFARTFTGALCRYE